MVLDLGVSNLPMTVFMIVHLTGFAIGAYLAYKSFNRGASLFGWGFALYAVAEVLYMGYHMEITTFLLSHTLAEVCDLVAFILVFAGAAQTATQRRASIQSTRA
jgi:hypothetical protein